MKILAMSVCVAVSGWAITASAQRAEIEYRDLPAAVELADAQSVMGQRYDSYISELPRRAAPRAMPTSSLTSTGVVSEPSPAAPAPEPQMAAYAPASAAPVPVSMAYTIQVGAFSSYANADLQAVALRRYGETRIVEGVTNGRPIYRVMLGGWVSREQAAPMLDLIKARGFDGFVTRAS